MIGPLFAALSRYWRALAWCAACAAPAFAQTGENVRVVGSLASTGPAIVQLAFECTGIPVCTGRYIARVQEQNCFNIVAWSDAIVLTGVNITNRGAFSGTIRVRAAHEHVVRHADGRCSHREDAPDFVATYSAHWDGLRATFSFPQLEGPPLHGTFRVELPPVFELVVRANIDDRANASAEVRFRPQDVGTVGQVFAFAMAPESRVLGASAPGVLKLGHAKDERKVETPIGCVLAQLNAAGQMVAVSSANLEAYLTGVLSAQGASVNILNGVPTSNVSGATFFVGYGTSSTGMVTGGTNRSVVTVPGSLTCEPAAPETGWWWNPLEDGRGYSIEKRGNNLFFAAFLYDVSGRSTWHVSSGPVSLDGTLYNGDLLSASGGQTLGGPYGGFPTLASAGGMTMTFNNSRTGTLVWPGGTVPIQRFDIVTNGMNLPAVAGQPESGWWWNEQEAGRGFFLEFQGGWLDIAGYMYDDAGNPVWYLNVGELGGTEAARSFAGNWWSYGNGMTLGGPWKPHTRTNDNVAPLTITFTGPDTAIMTLPNSRATNLTRHRF